MKKAFSLSELLVALTVVGVIVGILAPVAKRLLPNDNVMRIKKAHHVASVIINDMLHDENCYPDISYKIPKNSEGQYVGFGSLNPDGLNNPYKYPNCQGWSAVGDEYNADGSIKTRFEGSGADRYAICRRGLKFITLFMDRVGCRNTKAVPTTKITGEATSDECYGKFYFCETPDKMVWSFRNPKAGALYAYVDVNGPSKPNRRDSGSRNNLPMWDFKQNNYYFISKGNGTDHTADKYDTFRIQFYYDGSIGINNTSATNAIYNEESIR